MEEFMTGLDSKVRISTAESTMMWIVHNAMNKAHEKVRFKGAVSRLNEISKFYELAVIQLEGCLKFVQEEAEACNIVDTTHQDLLSDLVHVRDHLQHRLMDSELAILEKERELLERSENESRLRQALEVKDKELASLRNEISQQMKTRNEGVEEFGLGEWLGGDENRDEGFSELKHTVDQQMMNIRQMLEPEYDELTGAEHSPMSDSRRVEQMGTDIDILKDTVDMAFGKMQNAIFLSEMGPMEQQWKWTVEKDVTSLIMKGFMREVLPNLGLEMIRREKPSYAIDLGEKWSGLMHEINQLREDLSSMTSYGSRIPQDTLRKSLSDAAEYARLNDSLSNSKSRDEEMTPNEEGEDEEMGHLVARMIKNHESIIRKKREEMNWLKREIARRRGHSYSEKDGEFDMIKRRIQHILSRLDKIIELSANLNSVQMEVSLSDEKLLQPVGIVKTSGWPEEDNGVNLQSYMLGEIFITILKGFRQEFFTHKLDLELELLVKDDIHKLTLKRAIIQQTEDAHSTIIEAWIREKICSTVAVELIKNCSLRHTSALPYEKHARNEHQQMGNSLNSRDLKDDLEGLVNDEIIAAILHEILKEWNDTFEEMNAQCLLKEEIICTVCDEVIKTLVDTTCSSLNSRKVAKVVDNKRDDLQQATVSSSLDILLKMDICKVYLREKAKEWINIVGSHNFEKAAAEEMYQFVISEVLKDAISEIRKRDESLKKIMSATGRFTNGIEVRNGKFFIGELDSLLENIDTATYEIQSPTKIKEHDESKIMKHLFIEDKTAFGSASDKLQLAVSSKELVFDLQYGLCRPVINTAKVHPDQGKAFPGMQHDKGMSEFKPEDTKTAELDISDSPIQALQGFLKSIQTFQSTMHKHLGKNILRLEDTTSRLCSLFEEIHSIKNKYLLYKHAFIRRCQNLKKAEAEVDLLGDQVDNLLSLLEIVYMKLQQYSPVLQQHFEVSDILALIKKELSVTSSPGELT